MELSDAPEEIPSDRGLIPQCLNYYTIPDPTKCTVCYEIRSSNQATGWPTGEFWFDKQQR
jgi:hypothetical protein